MQTPARTRLRVRLAMRAEAAQAATGILPCRDTDAGELSLRTALRGADQLMRWARFTMNPSGPRTDAMRQMSSY